MIEFRIDPPIPTTSAGHVFVQTIRMLDGARELGRATWTTGDPGEGVCQILELWIDPAIRRSGHGKRLLSHLVDQARLLCKSRNKNLRRLWIGVGHKTGVVARSFLSSTGFHHVASTCGLLEDQDMMIYVKSLD